MRLGQEPAPIHIAGFGRVTDIETFGGWYYYVWKSLAAQGLLTIAHDLNVSGDFPIRRFAWQLGAVISGRGTRGYMFSNDFLELVWSRSAPVDSGNWLLNNFQLYPESLIARAEAGDICLFYYIDQTLAELVELYGPVQGLNLSVTHREDIVARERRGYIAARKICTFSHRSAEVLKVRYNIDPSKIMTVIPGANLDEAQVERVLAGWAPVRPELVVGFIGMDYRRKGLLKLAGAVKAARRAGAPILLRVIGPRPHELENTPGVELVGRINKVTEMRRFVELIASCHLGALLSSAEALGISLLEFLRLGVPVLGSDVGGIPDVVDKEVGVLVAAGTSAQEIAGILTRLAARGAEYASLRDRAWRARHNASWQRAAAQLRVALLT